MLGTLRADALVISNPVDVGYLTPFSGEASVAIITKSDIWVISDGRFLEELESVKQFAHVKLRKGGMTPALVEAIKEIGARSAVVQAEYMTVEMSAGLQKGAPRTKFAAKAGIVSCMRAVKGPEELAAIKAAISFQERAMRAMLPNLKPGRTESDIAAELEYRMRALGAEGTSFGTIVASGANAARPHARAGSAKTKAGTVLLIDFGAKADGYCSDMTRTFTFGRWQKELDRVYDVVLAAFHAGVRAAGPGVPCKAVDAAARKVVVDAGLGDRFTHGLGHGIGRDIHEAPRLASLSKEVLVPGMVVTVEPGVYLPGIGGVRIEDDILITSDGRRNLCSLPKDKEWATL